MTLSNTDSRQCSSFAVCPTLSPWCPERTVPALQRWIATLGVNHIGQFVSPPVLSSPLSAVICWRQQCVAWYFRGMVPEIAICVRRRAGLVACTSWCEQPAPPTHSPPTHQHRFPPGAHVTVWRQLLDLKFRSWGSGVPDCNFLIFMEF